MAAQEYIPFIPTSPKFKDRSGERYGRLVAVEPLRRPDNPSRAYWRCRCDCGNFTIVDGTSLGGNTTSCGCFRSEHSSAMRTKHGMRRTRTYQAWSHMIRRCRNPAIPQWKDYGGRGITHDPRWSSFENFFADMGEAPPGMSLDRRDNNGNYCKENCRWATAKEQNNNKRSNHIVEFRGERMSLEALVAKTGISYSNITARLCRGWSVERAATEPPFTSQPARRKKPL